jgi:hypothetical protein
MNGKEKRKEGRRERGKEGGKAQPPGVTPLCPPNAAQTEPPEPGLAQDMVVSRPLALSGWKGGRGTRRRAVP